MYSCSVVSDSATPWTAAHQASLSITISQKLLKLMSIESMMPSHPLLPPSAFCLSQHQSFSNESAVRTWWPKYWRFDFSISPSDEYCGLISFRIDWFDFLAVQGTLKSVFQYHSLKASILWCSAFFTVQLKYLYMTIYRWKNYSFDDRPLSAK